MPVRQGQAEWKGTIREGQGTLQFANQNMPYTWKARFEEGPETNPEELLGAAHAGCFSMALSGRLTRAGFTPTRIYTTANVHLEKVGEAFQITSIVLENESEVPGIDVAQFNEQAEAAKANCPVSLALSGVKISLKAKLL
jgi:osmotically inducible protein OsmC